ncbi:hypothetical protein HNY73_006121 [Argiope bruennichi]|uniref:Uncharacterized protein n=1 Tax=Argiope bruennichi TaxID=94029 RepID=A0A8T0FJP4_ARGBR|nr:hypothetical protein HNY73_006121 [Argiope bruennichi]
MTTYERELFYLPLPPKDEHGFYMSVAVLAFPFDNNGNVDSFSACCGPFIDIFEMTPGWIDYFKEHYIRRRRITHLLLSFHRNKKEMLQYLKDNLPGIIIGDFDKGIPYGPMRIIHSQTSGSLYDKAVKALMWLRELFSEIRELFSLPR